MVSMLSSDGRHLLGYPRPSAKDGLAHHGSIGLARGGLGEVRTGESGG